MIEGSYPFQTSVSVAKKIVNRLFLGLVQSSYSSKFKNEFGETVYVFTIDESIPSLYKQVWKTVKGMYANVKDKLTVTDLGLSIAKENKNYKLLKQQ